MIQYINHNNATYANKYSYYSPYNITITSSGKIFSTIVDINQSKTLIVNIDSGTVSGLSFSSLKQKKMISSDSGIYTLNPLINLINWFRQLFHLSSM